MKKQLRFLSTVTLLAAAAALSTVGCAMQTSENGDGDEAASESALANGPTPTVTWTKVGLPWAAAKIAACGENGNRVYALNTDRTLYVSHASGRDGTWQYMATIGGTQQILCAGNALYGFNDDRSLWKNVGTDSAVSWAYVGNPAGAKQLTGATLTSTVTVVDPPDVPEPGSGPIQHPSPPKRHTVEVYSPVLYALNDDGSFYKSVTGADSSWGYLGKIAYTTRIAAGAGPYPVRPFALNSDQSLWLNSGDGCDSYWTNFASIPYTIEIAASTAVDLYALNSDKSLFKGTVNGSSGYVSVASTGQSQRCDNGRLLTTTGNVDQACWQGTCNAGLDCIDTVCRVHECKGQTRDVGGQCVHCGSTHEVACTSGGEYGCFDVHTAPDATGHCEFDHWCGTEGKPCCNADYLGGDCNDGTTCIFQLIGINHCGHTNGGGVSGGYNPCPAGQTAATYTSCVDCDGGGWHNQSMVACSQAVATASIQASTQCKVWDGACH